MFKATPVSDAQLGEKYLGVELVMPPAKNRKSFPSLTEHVHIACIGASLPSQIFSEFVNLCVSKKLVKTTAVNLCQGGKDVNRWANPGDTVWSKAMSMVENPSDINIVAMIHDDLRDSSNTFPESPMDLSLKILSVVEVCKQKFPNLKGVLLFGRPYCGSPTLEKHQDPAGYHNGFAVKFAVESYTGKLGIQAFDLWTNETEVRSDGVFIKRSFYEKEDGSFDGIHMGRDGALNFGKFVFRMIKRSLKIS